MIHPTLYSSDTLESCIKDEDMFDTMGDYIMEAMELKNVQIYDDYGYSCLWRGGRGGIKWMTALNICMIPFNRILEIIYIYMDI